MPHEPADSPPAYPRPGELPPYGSPAPTYHPPGHPPGQPPTRRPSNQQPAPPRPWATWLFYLLLYSTGVGVLTVVGLIGVVLFDLNTGGEEMGGFGFLVGIVAVPLAVIGVAEAAVAAWLVKSGATRNSTGRIVGGTLLGAPVAIWAAPLVAISMSMFSSGRIPGPAYVLVWIPAIALLICAVGVVVEVIRHPGQQPVPQAR